jgi:hypothetical protein
MVSSPTGMAIWCFILSLSSFSSTYGPVDTGIIYLRSPPSDMHSRWQGEDGGPSGPVDNPTLAGMVFSKVAIWF